MLCKLIDMIIASAQWWALHAQRWPTFTLSLLALWFSLPCHTQIIIIYLCPGKHTRSLCKYLPILLLTSELRNFRVFTAPGTIYQIPSQGVLLSFCSPPLPCSLSVTIPFSPSSCLLLPPPLSLPPPHSLPPSLTLSLLLSSSLLFPSHWWPPCGRGVVWAPHSEKAGDDKQIQESNPKVWGAICSLTRSVLKRWRTSSHWSFIIGSVQSKRLVISTCFVILLCVKVCICLLNMLSLGKARLYTG